MKIKGTLESLIQTDKEFAACSIKKGAAEAFRKYLDDEAIMLSAGSMPVTGNENIFNIMKNSGNDYTLEWGPEGGGVAGSGDLGWTWGYFINKFKGDAESPKTRRGKYLNVWKFAEGKWKVIVDMGNSNGGNH